MKDKEEKEKIIDIAIAILFGIAVIVALIMSWFSMTDLAINTFGLPELLAWIISLAFDIGAIFLALITVSAALKGENATMAKLATLAFIGTSLYINVVHADVSGYGTVGMIMFGAAPAIVFIAFEVYLRHMLKRELRVQGLIPDRMPKVGALTWVRHPKPAFSLASKALMLRLVKEDVILNSKNESYENREAINVGPATVAKPSKNKIEKPKPLPQLAPAMQSETISEPLATPVVEVKEEFKFGFQATPTFTATKPRGMAIEAYKQGFEDHNQIAEWISKELGQPVNPSSVQKYKSEAKK